MDKVRDVRDRFLSIKAVAHALIHPVPPETGW